MKLNSDRAERRVGWILAGLWISVLVFYCLWDGWVWEWLAVGYGGANQHVDLDLFDMQWERASDGRMTYLSTNNLFNIIYICYFVFFMAWVGLLFGSRWARQGVMATMAFCFGAAVVTLTPVEHLYPVQIAYDIVHVSSIAAGLYFFYKDTPVLKLGLPALGMTWILYLLSRVLCEPWPYWSEDRNAFFSVNQINEMPFYFFGLEYVIVVLLFLGIHAAVIALRRKLPGPRARVLTPLIIYGTLVAVLKSLGLIEPPHIDPSAFAS